MVIGAAWVLALICSSLPFVGLGRYCKLRRSRPALICSALSCAALCCSALSCSTKVAAGAHVRRCALPRAHARTTRVTHARHSALQPSGLYCNPDFFDPTSFATIMGLIFICTGVVICKDGNSWRFVPLLLPLSLSAPPPFPSSLQPLPTIKHHPKIPTVAS